MPVRIARRSSAATCMYFGLADRSVIRSSHTERTQAQADGRGGRGEAIARCAPCA
ncbi:hypothetical protein ACFPM0_24050 [Pseudonocardia sulfidoxydans]|uniref:hypothetical protein n=1 Tax=Pseudonocardia sulfidoxydans TaxID=54011 RepID=UPI0036161466